MGKKGKGFPLFLLPVFLFFILLKSNVAQEPHNLTVDDSNLIHWAFAPAYGTGVYRLGDDREIYVFRITPMFTHRFTMEKFFKDRDVLLEFRFPLTFGIHNFNLSEIFKGVFPDSLHQISFTPGLELKLPVTTRWNLRIFGHLGYGSAIKQSGESALIYYGGIMSRLIFPIKDSTLGVLNGYATAGYTPSHGLSSDLSNLTNGVEFDFPIGRIGSSDKPFFLKTHVMNFWYFDNIDFFLKPGQKLESLEMEWEIGVAVGKAQRLRLWLFQFDRIGVGYRFSRQSTGIRIYFSSYFR